MGARYTLFLLVLTFSFTSFIFLSEHLSIFPHRLAKQCYQSTILMKKNWNSTREDSDQQAPPVMSQWTSKTWLATNRKCSKHYKLLVLVTSAPTYFHRRQNIRSTWAQQWHNRTDLPEWKTVFMVGRSQDSNIHKRNLEEAGRYEDLILGNFQDSFHNLSVKIIMGFEWATNFCQTFDFIIKSDDDVFLSIPKLIQFLQKPFLPKTRLYAGNIHANDKPMRYGKYKVSKTEYPAEYYPMFASGGGFIVSKDVAKLMVEAHIPGRYFKLDDVYIGMLAFKVGVPAIHGGEFQGVGFLRTDCACWTHVMVQHGADTQCMKKLYSCGKWH